MPALQLTAVLVASATWLGFGSTMWTYFRFASQRTQAKTALVVAGFICSVAQIVVVTKVRPPSETWFWIGLAGYAIANVLFWSALRSHGKAHPAFAFVDVPPSTLTTAGPYRLVRHPIYTSYLLAWAAGAAIVAEPWLMAAVAVMGFFYGLAALREERWFMSGQFASAYRDYRRRTGMFVPRVLRIMAR
ncbi:MAG TPA: isoprenylcysteine carboxylmethyltransferase family protein [Gemmataceae bacterium]|nr:isoprenylcysteine carboxylmethyltransferase family protein [Gemmataceae bacterium]